MMKRKLIPFQTGVGLSGNSQKGLHQSHIDYVAEVIIEVFKTEKYKGLLITEEAKLLRHFTAKLKPVVS